CSASYPLRLGQPGVEIFTEIEYASPLDELRSCACAAHHCQRLFGQPDVGRSISSIKSSVRVLDHSHDVGLCRLISHSVSFRSLRCILRQYKNTKAIYVLQ